MLPEIPSTAATSWKKNCMAMNCPPGNVGAMTVLAENAPAPLNPKIRLCVNGMG